MFSDVDYNITETGLQRDQPPIIGDLFSLAVIILKNDNAEGILEFRQDYVDITGKRPSKYELKLAYINKNLDNQRKPNISSVNTFFLLFLSVSGGGCWHFNTPGCEESRLIWRGICSIYFQRPKCNIWP